MTKADQQNRTEIALGMINLQRSCQSTVRQAVRRMIADKLNYKEPEYLDTIFDLKKPLVKVNDRYISLAHGAGRAVIAISTAPVGVDIERNDKVPHQICDRFSTPLEISSAPSPTFLWCAKESVFKVLFHETQPKDLNGISVWDWQMVDGHHFFEAESVLKNGFSSRICGRASELGDHTVAISWIDNRLIKSPRINL